MGKYIDCHQFGKEESMRIQKKVLTITFSRDYLFLATTCNSVLIYDLKKISELEHTSIFTVGLVGLMSSNVEGELLATLETENCRSSNKNVVRAYLNLKFSCLTSRTRLSVAGYYINKKRLDKDLTNCLLNDKTVLAVELPLKHNAVCLAVDPVTCNVLVGTLGQVLIYTCVYEKDASDQTVAVDMNLVFEIELSFNVKKLNVVGDCIAAISNRKCQVFKLIKHQNELPIQNSIDHLRHESNPEKSSHFFIRQDTEDNDHRHILNKRTISTVENFANHIRLQSCNDTGNPKRRFTITRQLGQNYKEFNLSYKNTNISHTFEPCKENFIETPDGGMKLFGAITGSSRCPNMDLLYKKSDKKYVLLVLVYHRCRDAMLSSMFSPDYKINKDTEQETSTENILISTTTEASLYKILHDKSVYVFSFLYASPARQVLLTGTHLYVAGRDRLEVYANPVVVDLGEDGDKLRHTETCKEPLLLGIHLLSVLRKKSFLHLSDKNLSVASITNNGENAEEVVDLLILPKPSAEYEADQLKIASARYGNHSCCCQLMFLADILLSQKDVQAD